MTRRQQQRLETLRNRLQGHVAMNHAPDAKIVTITAVREIGSNAIVLDYIDHTTAGDPSDQYEIGLDDFPDEDDDFLADMYLQNLIEDLLAAD